MSIRAEAKKISQREALRLLDLICEPWRGCDAEFEAEDMDFNAPLGRLIAAAFAPGRKWEPMWEDREADST